VEGPSCHHVWLVALGACRALSMDYFSYGRSYCCTPGLAPLCVSVPVCFPFSPCGAELGHVWHRHSFSEGLYLSQCLAADLKLLWTERPDKLGVGVT
jgi:hypothetical protein